MSSHVSVCASPEAWKSSMEKRFFGTCMQSVGSRSFVFLYEGSVQTLNSEWLFFSLSSSIALLLSILEKFLHVAGKCQYFHKRKSKHYLNFFCCLKWQKQNAFILDKSFAFCLPCCFTYGKIEKESQLIACQFYYDFSVMLKKKRHRRQVVSYIRKSKIDPVFFTV